MTEESCILAMYQRLPAPIEHLYQLTLRTKGEKSNVYSMGTSLENAFDHYLNRLIKRKEKSADLELVAGELANPHSHQHS